MITVTLYIECSGNEVQFIICEIYNVRYMNTIMTYCIFLLHFWNEKIMKDFLYQMNEWDVHANCFNKKSPIQQGTFTSKIKLKICILTL